MAKRRKKPAPEDAPDRPPEPWCVDLRAAVHAGGVLYEYGTDQFDGLDRCPDAGQEEGPVLTGLRLVVRAFVYELLINNRMSAVCDLLRRRYGLKLETAERKADEGRIDSFAKYASAKQLLAALVELSAVLELGEGPNRALATELLDFAELDWAQLQEQARRDIERERKGEPTSAERIAAAEKTLFDEPETP